jgi:peptidoglycan/LPS O-acetylase OafA/YrhL
VLAFVKINNDLFSLSYILVSTFIFSTVTYYVIEKPGIALYKYRLKYRAVNNKNLPQEKNGAPVNPETLQGTILTSRNTKE